MYIEFTERVPGSAVVSREKREMPESPHIGDVVPVWIEGKLVPCRVVARTWTDLTFLNPNIIVQVAQISQVAGGSDGETEAP